MSLSKAVLPMSIAMAVYFLFHTFHNSQQEEANASVANDARSWKSAPDLISHSRKESSEVGHLRQERTPTHTTLILSLLEEPYSSERQKFDSVLHAISQSGPPDQTLVRNGASLAGALNKAGISSNWNCFQSGCYYQIVGGDEAEIRRQLVHTRGTSDVAKYVLAVTPEDSPHKLAILINVEPDLRTQRSQ